MSMYDTLAMLKPGAPFAVDDLHRIVLEVIKRGPATVRRQGNSLRIESGDAWLQIDWNNLPHVTEESDEIAERFSVPSRGCRARFEMTGDDAGMDLFNDYLLINERLHGTGQFVIFDTQGCKLLFEQ